MQQFTGWQYLLIDVANHYGHDKMIFEDRIKWAEANLSNLENLADQAEVKPLYLKAVMAIRKAQQRVPTGHLVGLDATCSGIQIMSALTGCIDGARSTGMVTPGVRADAYSSVTQEMQTILGADVNVSRKQAKQALMTSFYGSKAIPKQLFGEDTPELSAFYEAAYKTAPGAWELLQVLLQSWQAYALEHSWKLPDGYDARVKVMKKQEVRIEVDELDHSTFSYEFYENQGSKTGLSNVANLTHSMDAWVLRSMHRRCNYNREVVEDACSLISIVLTSRALAGQHDEPAKLCADEKVQYYMDQYARSTLADVVIVPHLNSSNVNCLSTEHLQKLESILRGMLQYQPFELVTVHDEFKAHPNNLNHVREQYRQIMAEIADSNVLDDLLSQLYKSSVSFNKMSFNLGDLIRKSEYALC